ncbi:hypothetical protein, variant [Sphaeroforma arctica JP610]|uniref:Sugar phosphate transporter domain-containing protein n=1 Tax=Sphaeroforma arctica JP610 TaxID=667725 RepID=A0A0L0G7L1_9EUKA|nr:hypothetical protein, variant [Sphaeroforma arctica JP610]KNC85022.1 hypothetical protein, variant [Sphaeroforma arctica JP610]|eukprot:XP_014158924.1 hypothetical protein, variant [Sphaeroforma arctica JP610]
MQLVFSLAMLLVLKKARVIEMENFSQQILWQTLPLSLTFIVFLVWGMISLRGVNIAMYTALRRATLIFIMGLDYILQGKVASKQVMGCVGVMMFGAFVAAIRDLEFDAAAYGNLFFYNFLTALYLVLIQKVKQQTRLSTWGLMYYNNVVCIPCLTLLCLFLGEFSAVQEFDSLDDFGFQISMLGSMTLAFVLNYSIFWNTAVNSPLTQSVCGQLKDVLTIIIGVVALESVPFDPVSALGIVISFAGSGLYAKVKYDEGQEEKKRLPK